MRYNRYNNYNNIVKTRFNAPIELKLICNSQQPVFSYAKSARAMALFCALTVYILIFAVMKSEIYYLQRNSTQSPRG